MVAAHLRCVAEIVVMAELRSECRHVLSHPREIATVAFGVCLDAAFHGSGQTPKGSLPNQGRTAFAATARLQLFTRKRPGQLQQDPQPC